jgi:hypothetical protein
MADGKMMIPLRSPLPRSDALMIINLMTILLSLLVPTQPSVLMAEARKRDLGIFYLFPPRSVLAFSLFSAVD